MDLLIDSDWAQKRTFTSYGPIEGFHVTSALAIS